MCSYECSVMARASNSCPEGQRFDSRSWRKCPSDMKVDPYHITTLMQTGWGNVYLIMLVCSSWDRNCLDIITCLPPLLVGVFELRQKLSWHNNMPSTSMIKVHWIKLGNTSLQHMWESSSSLTWSKEFSSESFGFSLVGGGEKLEQKGGSLVQPWGPQHEVCPLRNVKSSPKQWDLVSPARRIKKNLEIFSEVAFCRI